MNLLAFDVSSHNFSLCIKQDEKLVLDINEIIKFGASELVVNIEKNLKKFNLDLDSFDAFVIGAGPGSFTGLRISFSVVKAFMLALDKPVIPVCSFYSCAYPFRNDSEKIAVIADARRAMIYLACYKSKNGKLTKDGKERLIKLEDLIVMKDYLFITYDSHIREALLACEKGINFYSQDVYPKAKYLLPMAEGIYRKNKFISVDKLTPLYLHPKTCQIRKKGSIIG